MKILHSSDIHGKYKRLLVDHKDTEFDVWLDTGDFFSNLGRVKKTGGLIIPEEERLYQGRWLTWKMLAARFKEWLAGRPVIIMPGNHDFLDFSNVLSQGDCPNVHRVRPEGFELFGLKWAGFREIPYISNEWVGETDDFADVIERTFAADPDVLVTHGPPGSILDEEEGYGIAPLTTRLAYHPHKVKHHFFGHCHVDGGKSVEEMGIKFYNGACRAILHDLDMGHVARGF